jgi:hypothetical protein
VYCPLSDTHKNEIKHQILMFHYINQQCSIFAILVDPNDPTKILETRPKTWSNSFSSMFFIVGGLHTTQIMKVNCILHFSIVGVSPTVLVLSFNSFELIHFLISLGDTCYGRYQQQHIGTIPSL